MGMMRSSNGVLFSSAWRKPDRSWTRQSSSNQSRLPPSFRRLAHHAVPPVIFSSPRRRTTDEAVRHASDRAVSSSPARYTGDQDKLALEIDTGNGQYFIGRGRRLKVLVCGFPSEGVGITVENHPIRRECKRSVSPLQVMH